MNCLITGSSGYLGTAFINQLQRFNPDLKNINLVGIDKVSSETSIRIEQYIGDFGDINVLRDIQKNYSKIDLLVHFGALKVANESLINLSDYYHTNIEKTLCLIDWAVDQGVSKILFASSASIYDYSLDHSIGNYSIENNRISETSKLNCMNPYGVFKRLIESELIKLTTLNNSVQICNLRIFNPIGKIKGVESGSRQDSVIHRMMYSWQNQIDFEIRGNQYNTFDGTPVRDFIDIRDLCDAIIAVIGNLESNLPVPNILNLASGVPVTVLQLVNEFNAVISELELVGKPKKLNWKIVDTNEFDVRGFAADVDRIKKSLNWNAKVTLSDSIKSEVVYKVE